MVFPTLSKLFWSYSPDTDDKYTLTGTLNGHAGPINALAFNGTNTLLASGGDDEEVHIWDLERSRLCQRLMDPAGRWGQVTCVQFITPDFPSNADWLCLGTGRGILALYRKSRRAAEFSEAWSFRVFAAGDSVEAIAFDPNHQRLAVSSHYGKISMLRFQQGKFVELWEDELLDAIPRALLFSESGRLLSIFAMETGAVFCRDVETSVPQTVKTLKTAIGYVSQCQRTGNVLIDNMRDGFDFYPYNRTIPSRTFHVQTSKMYVKFGEAGKVAVCGSDHGRIYIYNVGKSKSRQELLHGGSVDAVQIVETSTTQDSHLIASGISSGKCNICIWKRPIRQTLRPERGQTVERLIVCNVLMCIFFIIFTRETWRAYFDKTPQLVSLFFARESNHVDPAQRAAPTLSLEEILYEMDDRKLRHILKMPAGLKTDDSDSLAAPDLD